MTQRRRYHHPHEGLTLPERKARMLFLLDSSLRAAMLAALLLATTAGAELVETVDWIAPEFSITQGPPYYVAGGPPPVPACGLELFGIDHPPVGTARYVCPAGQTLEVAPLVRVRCLPLRDANGDGWIGFRDLLPVYNEFGLDGFNALRSNYGREVCVRWLR